MTVRPILRRLCKRMVLVVAFWIQRLEVKTRLDCTVLWLVVLVLVVFVIYRAIRKHLEFQRRVRADLQALHRVPRRRAYLVQVRLTRHRQVRRRRLVRLQAALRVRNHRRHHRRRRRLNRANLLLVRRRRLRVIHRQRLSHTA